MEKFAGPENAASVSLHEIAEDRSPPIFIVSCSMSAAISHRIDFGTLMYTRGSPVIRTKFEHSARMNLLLGSSISPR